ncbi:MAG: fatty acid--CoA ligase family protein [Deltaproteobacteria bacterium]|nr:fatty acid--CoA ligase family protein [Deltaproteobacteria bacterium]
MSRGCSWGPGWAHDPPSGTAGEYDTIRSVCKPGRCPPRRGAPALETTIPRLLWASAARFGDAPAVEDGATTLSFAELADAGLRAARALLTQGFEPGERVALWAPNRWEWIVAALGVQLAGGAIVTLNTRYKGGEAAYQINKCRTRWVFTVGDFLGFHYADALRAEDTPSLEHVVLFDGEAEGAMGFDTFLGGADATSEGDARARAEAVGPDDVADIIFTSGTTGLPKGVMASHAQNLRTFDVWSGVVGLREGDRYLIVNPFFHTFGYKAGWLACLMRGATALPEAAFDVDTVLERISKKRISVLPGTPTLFQSLLAHPKLANHDISSLRMCSTGGAAVPVELVRRMRDELGFETVVTAYGLTESTGLVTVCHPGDDPELIATTCGRPIPEIEVRCVDADGNETPRGEPGEVWVRGYNVMQGYFEEEEATREALDADGWLHTGDVAVMDERGYLAITDRIKDMFIMGGFNCYPAEIESLLFEMEGVAQAAVIGVPDARMGEVGMAFVVPAPGATLSSEGVVAWAREHMANFKVPRHVVVADTLPMNASGKVLKNELRAEAERRLDS